jgi:hypothetical protein
MWDGHSEPKDREEMREAAGFLLSENELDRVGREDGGLYSYLNDDGEVVIRATNNRALWVFTSWAAIKCYVAQIHALAEQNITDAAQLDVDRFDALLAQAGESAHVVGRVRT